MAFLDSFSIEADGRDGAATLVSQNEGDTLGSWGRLSLTRR